MHSAQIYVKTYGKKTSLLVSGEEGQVYHTSYTDSELMAIRRGASYIKNMLPYRDIVEIFPDKLDGKEVFADKYLQRLRLPISLGTELSKNKELSQVCLNNLYVELRFNNLKLFEKGNER